MKKNYINKLKEVLIAPEQAYATGSESEWKEFEK